MNDINYFYDLADKDMIKICECNLGQAKGLCIYNDVKCKIYLSNNIDSINKKCVLAEELAHYYKGIIKTNIFNKDHESIVNRSINEFRALKWVVDKLIPYNTFKQFYGQNMGKFEIAEELGITEDLVEKAYYIYEYKLKGCDLCEKKI